MEDSKYEVIERYYDHRPSEIRSEKNIYKVADSSVKEEDGERKHIFTIAVHPKDSGFLSKMMTTGAEDKFKVEGKIGRDVAEVN